MKFFLKFVSARPTQNVGKVGPFETPTDAQKAYRRLFEEGPEAQPIMHDAMVGKQVVDENGKLVINIG